MLKYSYAVVMCAVLAVALAAATGGHGEQTEGCHIGDLVIPFGQNATSTKSCVLYKCAAKDPEKPNIIRYSAVTCPPFYADPDVSVVEDLDKPYPQCCPRAERTAI